MLHKSHKLIQDNEIFFTLTSLAISITSYTPIEPLPTQDACRIGGYPAMGLGRGLGVGPYLAGPDTHQTSPHLKIDELPSSMHLSVIIKLLNNVLL